MSLLHGLTPSGLGVGLALLVVLTLAVASVVLSARTLAAARRAADSVGPRLAPDQLALAQAVASRVDAVSGRVDALAAEARERDAAASRQLAETGAALSERLAAVERALGEQSRTVGDALTRQNQVLQASTDASARGLSQVRDAVERQLEGMRQDSAAKLDQMRQTVDEKLQRTLDERMAQSFQQVSAQLEAVYKGLGEMRGLAQGVGDLRRVLSNVKTRGIVGEIQLGAILKEILAPEQYAENVATVAGSDRRVEYAVRLPGEGGETVWLPIDAKFPGDTYERLRAAVESGERAAVEEAWRQLEARLRSEAKDIREKYVAPPDTTSFGILFLPVEGLYAEVVSRPGLIEGLQRDYRVNVCGPSTMAALLNSLQMGFQTVAIQRHTDEIATILRAVEEQIDKYQGMLEKAQRQIQTADRTLDTLITTRTRAIRRKLRSVSSLELPASSESILGIDGHGLPLGVDDEATTDEGETSDVG